MYAKRGWWGEGRAGSKEIKRRDGGGKGDSNMRGARSGGGRNGVQAPTRQRRYRGDESEGIWTIPDSLTGQPTSARLGPHFHL